MFKLANIICVFRIMGIRRNIQASKYDFAHVNSFDWLFYLSSLHVDVGCVAARLFTLYLRDRLFLILALLPKDFDVHFVMIFSDILYRFVYGGKATGSYF